MDASTFEAIKRRMAKNPKAVLDAARKGSLHEMSVLANTWSATPGLIAPAAALDVFLTHLMERKVPGSLADKFSDPANLAFSSMLGITQMGMYLENDDVLAKRLVLAWPGIFKWSVYLLHSRVDGLEPTDSRRKAALAVLSGTWYSIGTHNSMRAAMVKTPATIETATKLWLEEDVWSGPSEMNVPAGSCVLGNLLKYAEYDTLERVLKVTGRNSDEVAKLAVGRLKRAVAASPLIGQHLTIYVDFICSLSRSSKHAFRNALLSANVIWNITTALVKISTVINATRDLSFLDAMVSGFGYLYNCLESSDGFTWVSQAIGAGLLQAFVDCSPQFSKLSPKDLRMVLDIFEKILPRYLVYRSIVEALDGPMRKLDDGPSKNRVTKSAAKDVWHAFHKLASERIMVVWHIVDTMKGKHVTCDNVKCQKIGLKSEVRRCSACLSTFYCSKECQATAWKEGDHRTMCKMKQQERLEGKSDDILKKDVQFFHDLNLRDARKHLPHLRALAKKHYPEVPYWSLIVCIDYNMLPPIFSVKHLDEYTVGNAQRSSIVEARNDAMIEKIKNNQGKYALLETRLSFGTGMQCGGHVEGEPHSEDEFDDEGGLEDERYCLR